MNQIPWNQVLLDEFIKLGCLSDEQEKIIRLQAKGECRVYIGMKLHMSTEAVNYQMKQIYAKYDDCQPFSDILPPRKKPKKRKPITQHNE